jgi:hypothetical protein
LSGLFDNYYKYTPAPLQNLGISLYGLKLYRREYGLRFCEKLEEFEKMPWYSYEEPNEYLKQRLALLIKHCYDNVPYYGNIMHLRKLAPGDEAALANACLGILDCHELRLWLVNAAYQ